MFVTHNFRSTIDWFEERRNTKTNGLLYGDTFSGKSYAAKTYAFNNPQKTAYIDLGIIHSYKSVILELYYELRRNYKEGKNSLHNRSYEGYRTTKEEFEEIISQFIRQEGIDFLILDELSHLKEKYFVRLTKFLADLNITLIGIEYTPKIQWHLNHNSDLVAALEYRHEMSLLSLEQTSFIIDSWQQENEGFELDRAEYSNIHHYTEGYIGTLIQTLNRAKHSYHHSLAADNSEPGSFQDFYFKELRETYAQYHNSLFSRNISAADIEQYGTRDQALIMTLLQELEFSKINEINYKYSPSNSVDKALSPQNIIDSSHLRDRLIKDFGKSLDSIGTIAGWFVPGVYDRWGMKKVDVGKTRSQVYSLIKKGYIQPLKQHKPYRYITTYTFNNFFR